MFDKLAIFLEAIKGIDQFADEKTKKIQWGLALIKVSGGEVFTTSDIMDFYSFHINDNRITKMRSIVIPTESIFPEMAVKAKKLAEKAFLVEAWISSAFTLGDFVHYQIEYNSITNEIEVLESKNHLNDGELKRLQEMKIRKDEVLYNLGTTYLDGVGIAGNFLPLIGEFIDEYVKFAKDLLGRAVQLYVEYKDRINNLMVQMHTELGLSEDEIRRELSGAKNLLACRKEVLALLNSNAMDLLSESDINEIHQMKVVFEDSISELNTKIKEFNRVLDDYAILQSPGVFTEYRFHLETGLIAVSESQETSVQSTTQRYDPLVVDLGGEGFNMKNMDDGVYFDLDMNLTREKTSWVAKEDALLAIDLDANGKIDNGAELFGDHFKMPDNTYAQSSIQALSTLDTNGDGLIDKDDAGYSKILLWKDENQNGISEENELSNLTAHNIKSIEIGSVESKNESINGSTLKNVIHFNYEGENNTGKGRIGEFLLNKDNVDVKDEDIVSQLQTPSEEEKALIEEITALPDIRAYGRVRTLRNAMYLDKSKALLGMVKSFINAKTVDEKDAVLDEILIKIGNAEGVESSSRGEHIDAKMVKVLETFFDQSLQQGAVDFRRAQFYKDAYSGIKLMYYSLLNVQTKYKDMESLLAVKDNELVNIGYLNSYISMDMLQNPGESENTFKDYSRLLMYLDQVGVKGFQNFKDYFMAEYPEYSKVIAESNIKMYHGTEKGEQLIVYSKNATVAAGDGNDTIIGSFNNRSGNEFYIGGKGNDNIQGGVGSDTYFYDLGDGLDTITEVNKPSDINTLVFGKGITRDKIDLQIINNNELKIAIKNTEDGIILKNYIFSNPSISNIYFGDGDKITSKELSDHKFELFGDEGDNRINGYHANDLIRAGSGNDEVKSGYGNDTLYGEAGDDKLYGGYGNDTVYGGEGNDTLYGDNGNDTLYGGDGDDELHSGSGEDVLEGGKGNDVMFGSSGSDTYMYSKGDGQDIIRNYGRDDTNDRLVLKDVNKEDVYFTRENDNKNVVINFRDSADRITLVDGHDYNHLLDEIAFGDGTKLSYQGLMKESFEYYGDEGDNNIIGYSTNDIMKAGDGNDEIRGYYGNDTLYGEAGNDKLYGDNGNDTLYGGDGDDELHSGSGEDVLEGGKGNDVMFGSSGSDTYMYSKGDGQDIIRNYGREDTNDRLVLKDANKEDVYFTRENDNKNVVINFRDSADSITLVDGHDYNHLLDEIEFGDGTKLSYQGLMKESFEYYGDEGDNNITGYSTNDIMKAGDGNDEIRGYYGNDTLYGESGDDRLEGENGNDNLYGGEGNDNLSGGYGDDIFEGGKGNDYLSGGYGSDTYVFNLGDGQDTINNYESSYYFADNTAMIDKLLFKNINKEDVYFTRENNNKNIVVNVKNSADRITILEADRYDYRLDEIAFGDGTKLSYQGLMKENFEYYGDEGDNNIIGYSTNDIVKAGDGNDELFARDGNDTIYGEAGDDRLEGENGNDNLYGGEGNDNLSGGYGDDIFEGGKGNDYLSGGYGSDTYVFNQGDGQDVISEYDSYSKNKDTINLGTDYLNTIFRKDGANLSIRYVDSTDSIAINNWYGGSSYQIEEIKDSSGSVITNNKVNLLIDQMSAFEVEKGMSWESALSQDETEVRSILENFWVSQ